MGRAKKKGASSNGEFSLFDDSESADVDAEEDLPRDEAGRAKIKHQYVDLLGIRVQKLAGRILNRERINKTLEGIYFVCLRCRKVCHNLDEGLVEDVDNKNNTCTPCAKLAADSSKAALKKPAQPKGDASPASPQGERKKPSAPKAAGAVPALKPEEAVIAKAVQKAVAAAAVQKASAAAKSASKPAEAAPAKAVAAKSAAKPAATKKKK